MKRPSWAATSTGLPSSAAAADDHAVVELFGQVEDRQVRADLPLFGADEFVEVRGSSNAATRCRAVASYQLIRAGSAASGAPGVPRGSSQPSSSIRRAPCASRSATVSGRAPPSLTENFRPPGDRRSTKSATTAPTPRRSHARSWRSRRRQSVSGSTRSTRTSRLPEATTPMIAGGCAARRRPRRLVRKAQTFHEGLLLTSFGIATGGRYRPPDQRTRSLIDRAASRLRSASSGSMPRSSGRRITPRFAQLLGPCRRRAPARSRCSRPRRGSPVRARPGRGRAAGWRCPLP